ncbi:hypothetical protein ACFORO_12420 [Amycolatopsis halotolerans]|uniref:Uncharacterized protein n=1 Tax=Amycolatopsis halotolerans TaxID=330083 RepID=A0ABV7QCG3_9PSEU
MNDVYLLFSTDIDGSDFISAHATLESAQAAKPGQWNEKSDSSGPYWECAIEKEPGWRCYFFIVRAEVKP